MILLSSIISEFEADFLEQYSPTLLPSQKKALSAMKICRTQASPLILFSCSDCDHQRYVPHSCGHRHCPHCQHHESQQWIERELKKQIPAVYFMITFTLPAEFRSLAWHHQRQIYSLMFQCIWETLQTFSQNDTQLQGMPGVTAVLHTHSRSLEYHPHIHAVMPAAVVDKFKRKWRKKKGNYLFNHKALAKVFRAKMLDAITKAGLTLPKSYPEKWIVDCKNVGEGEKALVYLGRYLYRGVIQEKDILACKNGQVTYRYQNSKTKQYEIKTVSGVRFLQLVLLHILPKGFRRARNYGFLHPNSKKLIAILHYALQFFPKKIQALVKKRPEMICECCGSPMKIIQTLIPCFLPTSLPMAVG